MGSKEPGMLELFFAVLKWANLLDKDGRLSITNVAVIIMVTKLAFLPTFTLTEVGAFVIAMLNYAHKRQKNCEHQEKQQKPDVFAQKIEEIESKLSSLALKAGLTIKKGS
jgi:hypothetical protein